MLKQMRGAIMDEEKELVLDTEIEDKLEELLEETNDETMSAVVSSAIQYYYDGLQEFLEMEQEKE
jgi:hypothetical protein